MNVRYPAAWQKARAAELDQLRLVRRLTEAEAAEADRLADNAYQREWRAAFKARFGRSYHHHAARAANRQVLA